MAILFDYQKSQNWYDLEDRLRALLLCLRYGGAPHRNA
jgi:hypothetical protein